MDKLIHYLYLWDRQPKPPSAEAVYVQPNVKLVLVCRKVLLIMYHVVQNIALLF